MIEDVLFFACESGHVRCRWKIRFYSWYEISLEITKFVGNQYRRIWYIFQRWFDQLNISRIANFIRPISSSNTNWFPDIRDTMRNITSFLIFPRILTLSCFIFHTCKYSIAQLAYWFVQWLSVFLQKYQNLFLRLDFCFFRKRIELIFSNIIVDNNSDW